MTPTNLPPPEANKFLQEVHGSDASLAPSPQVQPENQVSSSGKGLRRIIGILDRLTDEGRRRIYTSSSLDEGMEIFAADIRNFRKLPKSKMDGLEYDVVWIDADADVISFRRRRRSDRDPEGGNPSLQEPRPFFGM